MTEAPPAARAFLAGQVCKVRRPAPSHLALSPASTLTPTLLSHLHGELVTHISMSKQRFPGEHGKALGASQIGLLRFPPSRTFRLTTSTMAAYAVVPNAVRPPLVLPLLSGAHSASSGTAMTTCRQNR